MKKETTFLSEQLQSIERASNYIKNIRETFI